MSKKQKTEITDKITQAAGTAGIALMAAAVTLGLVEIPHEDKKVVLPMQPAFAHASENSNGGHEELRRERDEIHPHTISYSVTQRTPGRTGKA